jgi:RNA polymerase sigma-70 factor, ECF subfamily
VPTSRRFTGRPLPNFPRDQSLFFRERRADIPAMPPDLDAALADAGRGDQDAVEVLYRELTPRLLRYLRHHAGPVAEDLASEVWLALAPQLDGFDGSFEQLRALMFAIARRRVVDEYRRRGRTPARAPFDEALDLADAEDTETRAVEQLTAQGAVELLVRRLPADQAEIVLLRVLGDLDVEQVAEILGKSRSAVRVGQHRALQRLQRTFAGKAVTR